MRVGSYITTGSLDVSRLTAQQKALAAELRSVDQHVRAHEQAHLAASGGFAKGGPSFTYTKGPDGQVYATGGEVSIDASPVAGDPKATILKAQAIRAAAEAPSDPSSQDRAVAAHASQMESEARQELSRADPPDVNGYAGSSVPSKGALISVVG